MSGMFSSHPRCLSSVTSASKQQGRSSWASFAAVGAAGCLAGIGIQQAFFPAHGAKQPTLHGSYEIRDDAGGQGLLGSALIDAHGRATNPVLSDPLVVQSAITKGSNESIQISKLVGPWVTDDAMRVVILRR